MKKRSDMHGLSVKDGRLINNAPDCRMGISKIVQMKKDIRREEKIGAMAEAYTRSNLMGGIGIIPFGKRH